MALNVGELEATLRLKSDLEKQLADVKLTLKEFGQEVQNTGKQGSGAFAGLSGELLKFGAGLLTATKIISFGKDVLDTAGSIQKMAEQTRMTTSEVQKFMYIAGQSNTSLEAMIKAAQGLQQKLGAGDEGVAGALARLNITADAFNKLGTYDQMTVLSTAIGKIEDPTKQAALAAQLFGNTWREILPALKSDMKTTGEKTVEMSKEAVDAIRGIGDGWTAFQQALKASAGNTVVDITTKLQDLAAVVAIVVNPFGAMNKAIEETAITLNSDAGLAGALAGVKQPALAVNAAVKDMSIRFDDVGQATKDTAKLFDDAMRATNALDLEWIKGEPARKKAEALQKVNEEIRNATRDIGNLTLEQIQAVQRFTELGLSAADMAIKINVSENAIRAWQERVKETEENIYTFRQVGVEAASAIGNGFEMSRLQMLPFLQSLGKVQLSATTTASGFLELPGIVTATSTAIAAAMTSSARAFIPLTDAQKETVRQMDRIGISADEISKVTGLSIGIVTKEVSGLGDALEDVAVNSLQTLARAFEGGGNVIGAIKSLASQAGQAFADTYGEAMGGALNVGSKIGGGIIGAGVGAIIGGVSALTGWLRDGMKRDFERIGQEWGVNISEGLAKQLQEDVKSGKYRTELAALTSELAKLIQEAGGLDKSNLGNFTQKLRLSFSELERGGLTTAQVAKILNENWRAFIEASTDGNGRLSAGLKEIIQLNERFGTQSKEIAAYVQGQALAAMQGFAAVVAGLVATTDASERSKQSLDDLGIQALATFNAAVQGGMSTASALKEIAPALSALKGQYDALGLTIDDTALRSLLFQGDFVANNPAVVAAVDGLTQQMIALDNIGRETVAVFEAQQRTGFDAYTRIQAAVAAMGGTTEDALALMQGYLQQAFIEAKELGVPLDANTQMLINQSKELGLWRDQGKSANDVLVEGFERLGDRLEGFTRQIEAAVEAISQIPTAVPEPWEQWSPPPALPDYQVEMIPAPWDNWGAPPIDSSFLIPQSFARGGPVYAAEGFWKPRGTDTVPAMLTPGERVLSVPEARAWDAGARGFHHSADIVAELRHIRSVLSLLPESVATASRDAVLLASA